MKALFMYRDKIPNIAIFVIGVLLVISVGVIDRLTGYEASFSIFYLLPIALVSWFAKRSHAVIISILSAVTWLWADISAGHTYSRLAIPFWNAIMIFGFFLTATYLSCSLVMIKKLLEKEEKFARTDFLTGVANSRAFNESAKIEIDRSVRFSHSLSIAYIDIDNFKQVNDAFGHSQGDNLLQLIAKTIKDNTRSIDIVSRLGGDEFAYLFPETNQENAKTAINKMQTELLRIVKNHNWPVTFSIGVLTCYKSCKLEELIKEADNLMYTAKESGKNKIEYKIMKYTMHNRALAGL